MTAEYIGRTPPSIDTTQHKRPQSIVDRIRIAAEPPIIGIGTAGIIFAFEQFATTKSNGKGKVPPDDNALFQRVAHNGNPADKDLVTDALGQLPQLYRALGVPESPITKSEIKELGKAFENGDRNTQKTLSEALGIIVTPIAAAVEEVRRKGIKPKQPGAR